MHTVLRFTLAVFLSVLGCAPWASAALPAPLVFQGGVYNAASFSPPGLPGGAIARGSIFTIFGKNLGPAQPLQVSQFPLPEQLSGVSIELVQGSTKLNLLPLYVSATQINALMLSAAPLGQTILRTKYSAGGETVTSNGVTVAVVEHSPGIFTATGTGMGWGILQNFKSQTDQPINNASESIKPGDAGTLWLTGLGAVTGGDQNAPPVGDLPYDIQVWAGGKKVTRVLYKGRAPGISGLDQIVFFLPDDTPEGCFVPVFVVANGSVSNSTTVAVAKNGGKCSDPQNPVAGSLVNGGKVLMGMLARFSGPVGTPPKAATLDKGLARAVEYAPSIFAFDPLLSLPPPGACTVYSVPGNLLRTEMAPGIAAKLLDVGPVSANNGSKDTQVPVINQTTGVREAVLGGGAAAPFFSGADATLKAGGGADAQTVSQKVQFPADLSTNLDSIRSLRPGAAPTLTFPAREGQVVFLLSLVYDRPANGTAALLCLSPPGASSLQIPDYILGRVPEPRSVTTDRQAVVMAGTYPNLAQVTDRADALKVFLGGLQFRMKLLLEAK